MSRYFVCVITLVLIATTVRCHPATNPKQADNVTVPTCGGIINANSGTIDYLFPEGQTYSSNSNCVWIIRPSPAKTHMEFIKPQSFLDPGLDFVIVTPFSHGGKKRDATFGMNTDSPEEKVLEGSVFIVIFASTDENNFRGFQLHFSAIGAEDTNIRNGVDFRTGEVEGSLTYPSGGGFYNDYELSTFVITKNYTRNIGPFITIAIDSHDLENSTGCTHDGLLVYKSYRGILEQMAMYCGTSNEAIAFTTEDTYILILYSDSSLAGAGFTAHWKLNPE